MADMVTNLNELFVDTLKDLYDAEHQIIKALPKMIDQAQSPDLKQSLQQHLDVTHTQVGRLDQIFNDLKMTNKSKHCKGMEGIIKEGDEVMHEVTDPAVKDAALIAAAQKVEHYEIAGYGTARTYAQMLGRENFAQLLDQTAKEEGQADKKLTTIADSHVNQKAKTK